MPSKTPRAYGLGPLETIVKVGWGSAVYISVATHAAPEATGTHFANCTLSTDAIAAGATIAVNVRDEGHFFGALEVYTLTVMKFPRPLNSGRTAFTVNMIAPDFDTGFPASGGTYFCGHYFGFGELTRIGDFNGVDGQGFPVRLAQWRWHYGFTAPGIGEFDGIVSEERDIVLFGDASTGVAPLSEESVATYNYDFERLSYYDSSHKLSLTDRECDDIPTNELIPVPFDTFSIYINPARNHTVYNPGIAGFYDPAEAVKPVGSALLSYAGEGTQLWSTDVGRSAEPRRTGAYSFAFVKKQYTTLQKTRIFECYPNASVPGITYKAGFFRLPPYLGKPRIFAFDDRLPTGTPPPILTTDPTI